MTKEKAKPTRATIKSFLQRQVKANNLYVKCKTSFDGMVDMVTERQNDWSKVDAVDMESKYNFGVNGLWLVGQSRDYFTPYADDDFIGYEVYNCCGCSLIGMKRLL